MSQGYYSNPTVHSDRIVFVSEDDLWTVSTSGGIARRLTSGLGEMSRPMFSRDGKWIAFSAEEEGHREVYLVDAEGGELRRLTYLGGMSQVTCWDHDGAMIITSDSPTPQWCPEFFRISMKGGLPTPLNLGPVTNMDLHPKGWVVIERNSGRSDPAHWKRYRGGAAGKLWIADALDAEFKPFLRNLDTNFSRPFWVGDRIFFLSDHEGIGNVYSCARSGRGIKRHTSLKHFYARNHHTDGSSVVFHAGGDLYVYNIDSGRLTKLDIKYNSQRTQRQRKYVASTKNLEGYRLHPKGHKLSVATRGQVFTMGNWEGPVARHGTEDSVRYRAADWLFDDKRLALVSDAEGEEAIEVFNTEKKVKPKRLKGVDIGIVRQLKASPTEAKVAVSNNRNELLIVDLDTKKKTLIARNKRGFGADFNWSPDGNWVAYTNQVSLSSENLYLYDLKKAQSHPVTKVFLSDHSPCFDPEGKHLYFLGARHLDPVHDEVQFELSFIKTTLPCVITLQKDLPSPFLPQPTVPAEENGKDNRNKKGKPKKVMKVDLAGIEDRVLSFPVKADCYTSLASLGSKMLWTKDPVQGSLYDKFWTQKEPPANSTLEAFDFSTQETEVYSSAITSFQLSGNRKWMAIRTGNRLRIVKAGEKPPEPKGTSGRKTGKIDFNRIKVLVEPAKEWKQMLIETWRLQRDHFWQEGMGRIDWKEVLKRYEPILDRVNTRREYSDLAWELQGELGTSHCYEIGGDYRGKPQYSVGFLGADFVWDRIHKGYRVKKILSGDSWDPKASSPLAQTGVNARLGDILLEIDGTTLTEERSPHEALLHQADVEVRLSILHKGDRSPRSHVVKTLATEGSLRYRDWVSRNAEYVHRKSRGRIGYIHIPDMGARGFAEFHRHFLQEYDRDALIVDVRYNGGGNVSQLLLEKLTRQRIGVCESRWFGKLPVPHEAPAGPVTAVTNEHAGSDGDIFSHTFKMEKMGPLIGKRTWGGVVGIWPRQFLADGSLTTQPEFSHWYRDVGWNVENYGTDPTIDVDFAPHDYHRGNDPQLDRGIAETVKLLKKQPPFRPKLGQRPDLRP